MEGVCRREERSCRCELLEGEAGATGPARRRLFSPHRLIIKIPVRNASHCSSDALEAYPRSCRPRRWPGRVVSSRPYPGKADSGVGFSLQRQHRANRLAQGGQPVTPFKTETAYTLQPALKRVEKTVLVPSALGCHGKPGSHTSSSEPCHFNLILLQIDLVPSTCHWHSGGVTPVLVRFRATSRGL